MHLFGFGIFLHLDFLAIASIVSWHDPTATRSSIFFFCFALSSGRVFPLLYLFFPIGLSSAPIRAFAAFIGHFRTASSKFLRRRPASFPWLSIFVPNLCRRPTQLVRLLTFVATRYPRATFFIDGCKRPLRIGHSVLSLCLHFDVYKTTSLYRTSTSYRVQSNNVFLAISAAHRSGTNVSRRILCLRLCTRFFQVPSTILCSCSLVLNTCKRCSQVPWTILCSYSLVLDTWTLGQELPNPSTSLL